MRREVVELLACPLDGAHPLELHIFAAEGAEVLEGALVCPQCGRWYAILDGIPHLVRDGLRMIEEELDLLDRHRDRLPPAAATWQPFPPGADF